MVARIGLGQRFTRSSNTPEGSRRYLRKGARWLIGGCLVAKGAFHSFSTLEMIQLGTRDTRPAISSFLISALSTASASPAAVRIQLARRLPAPRQSFQSKVSGLNSNNKAMSQSHSGRHA